MSLMIGQDIFPPLFVVGGLLAALWQYRQGRSARFCQEMRRLEWAADAAKEHGKALDTFMHLPSVSGELKTFLLDASDALERREFARVMAKNVKSGFTYDKDAEGQPSEIWTQVVHLATHNVEAYDIFVQAFFSGIAAALLRWPETAQVVSRPLAPTQGNIKREVVVTARAVRESASHRWPGNMMPA